MKLVVISHKETWKDPSSPSGYATIGGFPFQMNAISEIFDETLVMVPIWSTTLPSGSTHLTGHNLSILPLPEPQGRDFERKIQMLTWIPRNLPVLWREVRRADAVHTPVPGDIGFIGLVIALLQKKYIFVRHCGTWKESATLTDKILFWLLEFIAGGKNVVLATGGSDLPPSSKNPHITWIFSTTLTSIELEKIPHAQPWIKGKPLRLITVCRLSKLKNVQAIIQALPSIMEAFPAVQLDILGEGEYRPALEKLSVDLNLNEKITFHGNVGHAQVLKALTNSHFFVFPTQVKEGFPKAVLESLACGLPIITSRSSILPQLVKDCGYVLPDTTPKNITHAVLSLTSDPGRLAEMPGIAINRSHQYTLENWKSKIANRLESAWGPLRRLI